MYSRRNTIHPYTPIPDFLRRRPSQPDYPVFCDCVGCVLGKAAETGDAGGVDYAAFLLR
jgi:hypothetical protein